jgi:geranylgeranyl diphosphate synthase type I
MVAESWIDDVRSRIDARLASYFDETRARAIAITAEGAELVDAIARLTMRGGKRLRPALLFAAFRAVREDALDDDAIEAGAALELLQTYLLIHDDWMDADEQRRGGPSVHAELRDAHGGNGHLGASLAVLAGNLASAHAWELLVRIRGPEARLRAAIEVFLAIHQEVVLGQQLDLLAAADVSRMQQLKTGSYTVRGPLLLGAALAGATSAQRAALEAFGIPLGEAFQMRDDLLGTFGDPARLGKPVGGDLRAGKRTALVRAAERHASPAELAELSAVLGRADATDEDLRRAAEILVACGAKAEVEARTNALLEQAKRSLDGAPLAEAGIAMLRALADRFALRER